MGFFSKVWNWVTKGKWAEPTQKTQEREAYTQEPMPEPPQPPARQEEQSRILPPSPPEPEPLRPQTSEKPRQREKTASQREIEDTMRNLQSKPTVKSVTENLNPEIVNKVPVQQKFDDDVSHLIAPYKALFAENGKLLTNDPQLLEILIRNRQQLRERFTVKFHLQTDKGDVIFEVFGCLLEEAELIWTYFPKFPMKLDYLALRCDQIFNSSFRPVGATDYSTTATDGVEYTIESLNYDIEFA